MESGPAEPRLARAELGIAAGVTTVTLVNYLATFSRGVGPGDSGELTLAALKLGVCHPPGYPLFTWLGRIATLFGGEPALATNTLAVLIAAAAGGVLYLACRSLGLSRAGGLVSALTLAFTAAFWQQAGSHEVYGFTILLLALLLLAAGQARQGEPRPLLAAGYLFGMALAHQPTALLWLPALALLVFTGDHRRRLVPALLPATLLILLGASTSLGTLVLARTGPEINWGDPSSLARFLAHAAGRQYSDLTLSGVFRLRLPELPSVLAANLGLPALLLALAGLARLIWRDRALLAAALLLLGTGLFALTYQVFDYQVQMLPAFLALSLLAGSATGLVERLAGRAGHYLAFALLAAPAFALFANYQPAAEARLPIVREYAENLLMSLPDGSVLVTNDDGALNAVRYLQQARGRRPDVTLVAAEMLFSEPYHRQLQRRLPLGDYLVSLRRAGTGTRDQRKQSLLADVVVSVSTRPVFVTTDVVDVEFFAGPVVRIRRPVPTGIVVRLLPGSEPLADTIVSSNERLWSSYRLTGLYRRLRHPDLANIQLIYASSRNNLGAFCREQGWREAARHSLDEALRFPVPDWLRQIVERQLDLVR